MSDGELRRKVLVEGRPHEIGVYRKSKSVWIAVGDYMGVTITVQDRSEESGSGPSKRQRQKVGRQLYVLHPAGPAGLPRNISAWCAAMAS